MLRQAKACTTNHCGCIGPTEWRSDRLKPGLQTTSAADAAHGAVGWDEVFFADVMAIFFLKDDFGEIAAEVFVIGAGAQARA